MREAFRQARFVPDDEIVPFGRRPASAYYYHAESGLYFVVEPLALEAVRIVTVRPPHMHSASKPKGHHGRVVMQGIIIREVQPVNSDVLAENEWLHGELRRVNSLTLSLDGASGCKVIRKHLAAWQAELQDRILALKAACQAARQKEDEEDSQQVYRSDGSINLVAAVKHLMDRIALLEQQVEQMKLTAWDTRLA